MAPMKAGKPAGKRYPKWYETMAAQDNWAMNETQQRQIRWETKGEHSDVLEEP